MAMEDQCSQLSWGFWYQDEGMDELKHTLLYTTLELETTLVSAKEEITKKEFELIHLKDVLSWTMKERDEAQAKCQKLMLEKLILQQQIQQKDQQQQQESVSLSGISSSEDESKPVGEGTISIISSPGLDSVQSQSAGHKALQSESSLPEEAMKLAAKKPLPEKGKLLQAVKDAGPLLQNLMLAGPLPQWQHPPPQLNSIDIPPVAISSPTQPAIRQDSFNKQPPVAISSPTQPAIHQDSFNNLNGGCLSKKRGPSENYDSSDSSPNTKYQKLVLH